jgi:hypothetical protein
LKREGKSSSGSEGVSRISLSGENQVSDKQLQEIAGQALKFQRYIFKRAWGIYYAVWAAAIAAFTLIFPLMGLIGVSQNLPWFFYAGIYGGVGLVAGFASGWIFRNADKAASLRKILKPDSGARRRWWLIATWWIGFYILIGISFTIFGIHALAILYAMLLTVSGFIYYQLGLSFQGDIPFEGKLAVVSYTVATIVSFAASVLTAISALQIIAWTATVVIWLYCALYSLKSAPDELAALSY